MRSLFFKIFVWFWLAMFLVVGVFAASKLVQGPPGEHEARFRTLYNGLVESNAKRVVDAWTDGRRDEARTLMRQLQNSMSLKAVLFDSRGSYLCGDEQFGKQVPLPPKPGNRGSPIHKKIGPPVVAMAIRGSDGLDYPFLSQMELPKPALSDMLTQSVSIFWRVLALVATVCAVCYLLARYVSDPVRQLRAVTCRLAEGELAARVGGKVLKRRDELGGLARDFDLMAEKLESLAAAQKRLLRDISHELRSPLSRLQVALALVRRKPGQDRNPFLDRIQRESERIETMVGQLLTITRLESGNLPTQMEGVDLESLLGEVVADADFEAAHRNRRVRILETQPCSIVGSAALLRSAIENVIRNAAAFTAVGTEVEVRQICESTNGATRATLEVRDHGPGVPEDQLQAIFRPFHRVADARDRETGGTGLGLAITEQIIRAHDGTVWAENAEGGGLKIRIQLPVVPQLPREAVLCACENPSV